MEGTGAVLEGLDGGSGDVQEDLQEAGGVGARLVLEEKEGEAVETEAEEGDESEEEDGGGGLEGGLDAAQKTVPEETGGVHEGEKEGVVEVEGGEVEVEELCGGVGLVDGAHHEVEAEGQGDGEVDGRVVGGRLLSALLPVGRRRRGRVGQPCIAGRRQRG